MDAASAVLPIRHSGVPALNGLGLGGPGLVNVPYEGGYDAVYDAPPPPITINGPGSPRSSSSGPSSPSSSRRQQQRYSMPPALHVTPDYVAPSSREPSPLAALPPTFADSPQVDGPIPGAEAAVPGGASSSSSGVSIGSASPRPTGPQQPATAAKPWIHDSSRLYFLPPYLTSPTPTSLQLVTDSLEVAKDYREFIDTIGRLEAEYGRGLAAAARRLEQRLDVVLQPPPGGRKPPEPSVVKGMRQHLGHVSTVARLHAKRPEALQDQLVKPLGTLERRGGEVARRMGLWAKDVRGRWDTGRERVDQARGKYHTAVREHDGALARFRACPAPVQGGKADSEWVRLEKAATEAEVVRADRKHAYLVALAGEGNTGGGGRDLSEGGGDKGWGEEARALYGHVQSTMLELVKHQANEDKSHADLVLNVYKRAQRSYDNVDLGADENAFLDWNTTHPGSGSLAPSTAGGDEPVSPMSPLAPTATIEDSASATSQQSGGGGGLLASIRHTTHASSAAGTSHPSLTCFTFVPPPSARDEAPILSTDKRDDRNWLTNRWLQSAQALAEAEGADGSGGMLEIKRKEFEAICKLCDTYSANRGLGNPEEVWERRIALLREMGEDERRVAVAKAEMACIENVLGPDPAPEMPHDFKDKQFAISAPCDACGQSVWAPIKPEMACRSCGIALHTKCALHVAPECTGLKTTAKRRGHQTGKIRRSITNGNFLRRKSFLDAPHGAAQEFKPAAIGRLEPLRDDELQVSPFVSGSDLDRPAIVAALDEEAADGPAEFLFARAQHPYTADGPTELSLGRGDVLRIIEPDLDGSGWIKVRRGLTDGDTGLVPESFLGVVGASTPPLDGGAGKFAVALFDFPPPSHTLGRGEIQIRQHALYELSDEGMAFDELWCELVVPDGSGERRVRGVVPKTYVKPVEM